MLRPLTIVLALAAVQLVPAQVDEKALDQLFGDYVKQNRNPSLSVAIVKDGKIAYSKGFGFADLENQVRAKADSVYRLGSVTKQFTATMVMQLVNEKKLTVDATLGSQLLDIAPDAWKAVTIAQLMNHTGGIPNYTSTDTFETDVLQPITPAGIIKTVSNKPLDFPPGSKWNYSNTAYELLGIIIERIDGRPFGASLKARILDPLGMRETYFTSNRAIVPHRAHGYLFDSNGLGNSNFINMDWPYAAGSMESTVLDLGKWDAALYGDKILPQRDLQQMWMPTRLSDGTKFDYGFGWFLTSQNSIPIVEHAGGIFGFTTDIRRAPRRGLTVIALTNLEGDSNLGDLTTRTMELVDPSLKVPEPVSEPDKHPDQTKAAKVMLQSVLDGTFDRNQLSAEMQAAISADTMAKVKQELNQLGPITRFTFTSEDDKDGTVTRRYRISLGGKGMNLIVGMKDGKIAELLLQ